MDAVVGVGDLATQTVVEPGRLVVRLSGECDMNSSDELLATVVAAIDQASPVVVDLAGLTFMDSSGIHALVVAHQRARAQGNVLQVTGATGVVAEVLQLTGLADLLAGPRSGPADQAKPMTAGER